MGVGAGQVAGHDIFILCYCSDKWVWVQDKWQGIKYSSCPIALTSGCGCRTSGHILNAKPGNKGLSLFLAYAFCLFLSLLLLKTPSVMSSH